MKIPEVRSRSIDEMGEPAFRTYLDNLGKVGRHARRRFLAELPEVCRRGLYSKWGFASVRHYAAVTAGVSARTVDELLSMAGKVERYKRIWDLLHRGEVGWSVLKVVAPHVKPETVGWWAKKLRTCTRAQIEDEVARLRAAAREDSGAGTGGAIRAAAGAPTVVVRGASSRRASTPVSGAAEGMLPGRSVADLHPGGGEDPHQERNVENGGGPPTHRLTLELSAEEMALLEAMRSQAEKREGRTLGLGQILRRAIRDQALGASCTDPTSSAQGSSSLSESTSRSKQPATPTSVPRASSKPPIAALLVLYRNVDTGVLRIASRQGLVPVEDEAPYQGLLTEARSVELADLLDRTSRRAAKPGSRYVPVDHQLLAAARSGNRCEFPDCGAPAVERHHLEPHAEGGRADAGNLTPLCQVHHDAPHSGWVAGHRGDVEGWEYIPPGGAPRARGADLGWQRARREE